MPKKQQGSARQQKKDSSFLTPDFLKKQEMLLRKKLIDYQNLRKLARQEIKALSSESGQADNLERAFTDREREDVAQRLEICGKIIPQVIRAMDLIRGLLAGNKKKSAAENYGVCIDCERLIPQKRLKAVPWADRCLLCQEEADASSSRSLFLEDSLA